MADKQQIVDTANTVFTNKTTVAGGITTTGASLVSAIAQLDIVAKIGITIALLSLSFTVFSFLMNWYYRYKEDRRAEELHQLELLKKKAELNEYKK